VVLSDLLSFNRRFLMLKRIVMLSVAASLLSASPSWAGADNWEYQGKAATGEGVTVNLDTVAVVPRSLGSEQPPSYFFRYKIGRDDIFAITACNGEYSTSNDEGDTFKNLVRPASGATRNMLDRVCNHRVKTARVFSPPSKVRMGPNDSTICTLRAKTTITTYGRYEGGDWFYTDACGKLGVIHSSQIR
jgi:hypothetical protein